MIICWRVCLNENGKAKPVSAGWGGHLCCTGVAEGAVWVYGSDVPWRLVWELLKETGVP